MTEPSPSDQLQILLPDSPAKTLVAGLPPVLRAAHRAAEELSPGKIVFCSQDGPTRWKNQLKSFGGLPLCWANGEPAASLLDTCAPLLVISPEGIPVLSAVKEFVAEARRSAVTQRWIAGKKTVAVYYHKAGEALAGRETAALAARRALAAAGAGTQVPGWIDATDDEGLRRAEESLYAELPQDTDGYLARFDRVFSIALSKIALKTPLTPNHITTASLALGLLGAWGLATGTYAWQLSGALLLWVCCILDGCDGEVARLKLLTSSSGAAYDLAADHIAHLATFAAIPIGVHRASPQAEILVPGVLLVSGLLGAMLSVWWLVLRRPADQRGRFPLLIERLASRDYVYLILALVALGRLQWFLWAAGLGSYIFTLSLWRLSLRRPSAE